MPNVRLEDTIAAVSTPPGEGGIGIIRISGRDAIRIAAHVFQSENGTVLSGVSSHTVHYGAAVAGDGRFIDQVLVTVFRAPKSYTGENVAEISAHGGSYVLECILRRTIELGARHAEPGEFTKRAFLNGRIDLAQAEAVSDVIRAKTDQSLQIAARQLQGTLSKTLKEIKEQLMHVYAHLEAYLDFPDEHLEIYSNSEIAVQLNAIESRIQKLHRSFQKGSVLREGALAVIIGRTNVGKSSLLNALLERDRAIVSDIPGTTRDILEEAVDIKGLSVRLVDTAGFTESDYPLDQAGVERTKHYLDRGDLFLWIVDSASELMEADRQMARMIAGKRVIGVLNKCDLDQKINRELIQTWVPIEKVLSVSAKTGIGTNQLCELIYKEILGSGLGQESAMISRSRHKQALASALQALQKTKAAMDEKVSLEFVVDDLKQALQALQELIGEVYSEDLLDVIFGEFCIGK